MDNNNMTALVSCFARAYHFKNNTERVFDDSMADKLLSLDEYNAISLNMSSGISFFNPSFKGTKEEALRFIVDNQLSPSVLARSVFCENALNSAVNMGCAQYVIFASGYDTFSLRNNYAELNLYELDRPEMILDKQKRIKENNVKEKCKTTYISCDLSKDLWINNLINSGFNINTCSFGSLLGISYYLKNEEFKKLLNKISSIWSKGSYICFDYPVYDSGIESTKNEELAKEANEQMQSKYSYEEINKLLEDCGFSIEKHYDYETATNQLFTNYNKSNPNHIMSAPKGVNYCLVIKK